MSEYVSKDIVAENVLDQMQRSKSLLAMRERIYNLEAADVVEREHGEWEWHPYSADWACICCDHHSMEHTNFCPHCGADMRGGDA